MTTKLSITVGIFPSAGVSPKFSTRTFVFTDIADAFNVFSGMLTTPPIAPYIPAPEVIVEELVV